MSTWKRAVMVVALVAGVSGFGGTSGAQPEGSTQVSNVYVAFVLRGQPLTGTQFEVQIPGVIDGDGIFTFDAQNLGPTGAIPVLQGANPRFLTEDGGADSFSFSCLTEGAGAVYCNQSIEPSNPNRIDYQFVNDGPGHVFWTITLTFGTCDGQSVTTFLADGDTPGPGNDVILGTPVGETINGHGGADRICGQGGNDTIRGGEGRDRLSGGNGADRLEGGALGDNLMGGAGTDTLLGLAGNDALDGGAQRDTCNGGTQRDTAVRCEVKASIP